MKYKLLFIIVDRANYGRLAPLILKGYQDKRFDIKTCFTGTTLLKEFGCLVNQVWEDGIKADYKVETENSYRSHKAMISTISNSLLKMEDLYEKLKPNAVVIIGDRYEALGCAIAAAYTNNFLIHLQGGEMSGSIDETTRHVITKMAHLHFPATTKAAEVIKKLGENPKNIINSGCPVGDLILSSKTNLNLLIPFNTINNLEINYDLLKDGFAIACIHPVTTGIENSEKIIKIVNKFISELNYPIIWITPNADPGSEIISKNINEIKNCHFVVNLSPITFQILLSNAKFAIGNSSSFVRDSTFSGTPVILLGKRQNNRETSENVINVKDISETNLKEALKEIDLKQKFKPSNIYGDGESSNKILDGIYSFLKRTSSKQKQLYFA